MTINQLFKNKPPLALINKMLQGYGLENINDSKTFSRKDLENLKISDFMNQFSKQLYDYYLPCKKKIYLKHITSKTCITILRQCLRIYNYKLNSKEKYIKSEKIIIYKISPQGNVIYENKKKQGCIISFD